ncbi:MAG TPA: Type 1 glutamine amidotransferase-like domain-containing protein [Pyrinomonadaceae bacterium]|nr:Type 1 glutamine amidotransferase-like domain-containing protein [Pyrinomonadaceae bacterium]
MTTGQRVFKCAGAFFLLLTLAASAEAKVTRYLTGNGGDVAPALFGPAHDFGGGGTDVDAAIQWMIDQVRGCTSCATKVDVVILRSTGSNGYNDYIYAMNGVDSVETLVITSARDSNTAAVEATVRNAEVVFFAGGDQCDYVSNFKGTLVETAVESVYARGGGVGGTSAGAAVMGEFSYDACRGSVTSSQALLNPFHRYVTFTYDFFNWADTGDVIFDSHFVTRDRMGRTMAFVARQVRDGRATSALGVGVNEVTSVVVDKNGLARVFGSGPAYFVLADHVPEVCEPGTPLTYSDFKIWKVNAGGTFDLRNRPSTGFYTVSVNNGQLSGDPY